MKNIGMMGKRNFFYQLKGYVESIFSLLGITLEASIFENNELLVEVYIKLEIK